MSKKKDQSGYELAEEISNGNKKAFERLFYCHHGDLCALAAKIIKSSDCARDVVQEVFLRLWDTRKSLEIEYSLKAYLYQAVWNEALNARKRQESRRKLAENITTQTNFSKDTLHYNSSQNSRELIEKIWEIVEEMPERRRFVFTLHRKHGLSYKEISRVMNISRKTVENHMGLALKDIRNAINVGLFRLVQLKRYN